MKLYYSNNFHFYPAGKMGKKGNFESDVNLLVSACNSSNVTGKNSNSSVKAQANSVVSKISTINFSPFLFFIDNNVNELQLDHQEQVCPTQHHCGQGQDDRLQHHCLQVHGFLSCLSGKE